MQSTLGNYQEVNIHKVKSLSVEEHPVIVGNGKTYVKTIYAKTDGGAVIEINFYADKEKTLEIKD
tara:strand:+ start:509 stop:703 length:195 start_codon:yes stop_codon:yes gene_type:complete